RPEIASEKEFILNAFCKTRSLISYCYPLNPEAVRSPFRSIANLEFHQKSEMLDKIGANIVQKLNEKGIRAVNASVAFPMEAENFPDRMWVVSHKKIAEAAGLGKTGLNRLILHPEFGAFHILGTILMDVELDQENHPIDFNPCFQCKLCSYTCPSGAIHIDGYFNFSACYTHNYREFMGGFADWIETIVESKNRNDYRNKISDGETVSMWQSLAYKSNYKAAYCMAVCPAGERQFHIYSQNRKDYVDKIVNPLRNKKETVYISRNSDAESIVKKKFQNKNIKIVKGGIYPKSIESFLFGLNLLFQPNFAKTIKLNAVYHFTFTGSENIIATIQIKEGNLKVVKGSHILIPDIKITADSRTWLKIISGEKNKITAVIFRKLKIEGGIKLLNQFSSCFSI
ncbi:MAG: SCP2 sterol-binding domain-containing protein, partial [Spirochaetia bacterium]|nr:SCP2 sterol-binding domain-containing protein [Spirochaetia bacterium]